MRATCQCGELSAEVPGPGDQIVACHCRACQRRSGSPLGVIAYFTADDVTLTGEVREYTRTADSGRGFTTAFCPTCGATVWFRSEAKPNAIGIPVGAFADPGFPPPVRSVWEVSRHPWLAVPGEIDHFPQGRS